MPLQPRTFPTSALSPSTPSYPPFVAISALFVLPSSVHLLRTSPSTTCAPRPLAVSTPTALPPLLACAAEDADGVRWALRLRPAVAGRRDKSWNCRERRRRWTGSGSGVREEIWPEGLARRRMCVPSSECCGRRRVDVGGLGVRENVVLWRRRLPCRDLGSVKIR